MCHRPLNLQYPRPRVSRPLPICAIFENLPFIGPATAAVSKKKKATARESGHKPEVLTHRSMSLTDSRSVLLVLSLRMARWGSLRRVGPQPKQ